jgi:hypothetical protein
MGKIGNIGNLDLKNYRIGFLKCEIDIKNYHIKIAPFSLVDSIYTNNIEYIDTIQFDTKYRRCYFKLYQNLVVFCFSYWFQMVYLKPFETNNTHILRYIKICVFFASVIGFKWFIYPLYHFVFIFYQYSCIQNSMKPSIS